MIVSSLVACSSASPQLARLYQTSQPLADQPPVILVHGAFGARLCDSSGKEHWPGNLLDLVFNDYHELALPFSAGQMSAGQTAKDTSLSVCGVTDTVAGRDFYGKIADTLVTAGGYQLAEPGTAVNDDQRRYYQFVYDWRHDNALSASKLDALVEQIRRDYQRSDLRVDVVAHSMGGLLTRYWLRYGVADMLNDNDFPVNNSGGQKVRRVILVGTPNLGSTSALQQLLRGGDFGVNTIEPEVLLTFPGAYQLLPHPIVDTVLGSDGEALNRDIFDLTIWRALEWGPYDLDPSIPRHRFSDFPLDYSVMFCEDHSKLTGNLTFQDNLLHILLSR